MPTLAPPRWTFWRALTDNDRGAKYDETARVWKEAEETGRLPFVDAMVSIACNENANSSTLRARATTPANLPARLRAGIVLEVAGDSSTHVAWHGRGPHENYCDRQASAPIGDYAMTVRDLQTTNYIRPGEQGHREETTRLTVGSLTITSEKPFGFNVYPWPQIAQDKAKHWEELPDWDSGKLYIHIDAAMMGVGGDNSWGARPQSRHQLKPGDTYELELKLRH